MRSNNNGKMGIRIGFLVLALVFCLNTQSIAAMVKAQVVVESLNIREGPSGNHKILGAFKQGQIVYAVVDKKNEWATVLFKGKLAYVTARNLEILEHLKPNQTDECDITPSSVALSVAGGQLKCDSGFGDKNRYERCSLDLNITGRSDCEKTLKVFYSCWVDYEYKEEDELGRTIINNRKENLSRYFFVNNGFGSSYELVSWRPGGVLDKVVWVMVRRLNCEVTDIFE